MKALRADLAAALSLVAIAVPEQIATARLIGMSPVAGLWAFVIGSAIFAVIGAHRWLSVGADSTIAPILAAGVVSASGVQVAQALAVRDTSYLAAAASLSILVGVLVVALGLARMSWLGTFISRPAVTGMLSAIGVLIIVHQLPSVLGLPEGSGSVLHRLSQLGHQLGAIDWRAVGVALLVLGCIVGGYRLNARAPGALVGVVAVSALTAVAGWGAAGLPVVGTVDGGLPRPVVPVHDPAILGLLLIPALTVALVILAQTAATEAANPVPESELGSRRPDPDRDLVAIGLAGALAGLVGAFAVNSSPPRTAIVRQSEPRTRWAGLYAAVVVAAVALFAGGLLGTLPLAALGAVLLFVTTHLIRVGEWRAVARFDPRELVVAVATFAGGVFVGVPQGVGVAIALSLADRVRREARPRDAVLGRQPGTDRWVPMDIGQPTETEPGVLVYLPYGPLWHADADYVVSQLRHLVDHPSHSDDPVIGVVLDLAAVSDIDYTAAAALRDAADMLRHRGISLALARASHVVSGDLTETGSPSGRLGARVYPTVAEAVAALIQPTHP